MEVWGPVGKPDEGYVEPILTILENFKMRLEDSERSFMVIQSKNTKLIKEFPNISKTSSNRYLRLLAVSRLFLDNIPNIQSSWVTQGAYIGQMALLWGANDLGSTMMEENVVSSAGATNRMNQEQMIELIKDIGEKPAKRDTTYRILEKF